MVIHFRSLFLLLPLTEASSSEQMLPMTPAAVKVKPNSLASFISQRSEVKVRKLAMRAEAPKRIIEYSKLSKQMLS